MQVTWSLTISQSSLGDAFANGHTYVDGFGDVMELFEPHIKSMYLGRVPEKEWFLSGITQTTSLPQIRASWSFFFKAVRHCLIETKWEVSRVTLKWSFLRTTYKTVQRSQRSKHCHFWRNWLFLLIKIQLAKKSQNFGKAPPPIIFFRDPSLSHNLHANHVIEGSKTFTGKARISRNIFSESWYFRFREVKLAGCCIPRNGTPPCSCIGVASQAAAATAGKFN